MSKFVTRCLLLLVIIPSLAFAFASKPQASTTPDKFVAGKDYEVIPSDSFEQAPFRSDQITVVEFFSYGCPACNNFEPVLEKWLASKPKYVKFERVPVVFEPNWEVLARAYYTAKTLGINEKITPDFFAAIHKDGKTFNNEDDVRAFFVAHGVKADDFNNAYEFSPGIDSQILRGNTLMKTYKIMEVPTILVGTQYKVNPRMVNGDNQKFIEIVNFLIEKQRNGNK